MKNIKIIIIAILAATALYASDNIINYLNASSNGDRIKIEWRSNDEAGVQKYEVERASKNSAYSKISELEAKGYAYSYIYYDESALKYKMDEIQSSTLYTYRIKIVNKDKSVTYSNLVNVSHSTSSVKRTWGMIKEMFK